MDRQIPFPVGDFYTLYQLLFKYDEHSGAGNVGWPGLNDKKMLDQQNREYAGFMRKAANTARSLLDSGIGIAGSKSEDSAPRSADPIKTWPLTVWNSLSSGADRSSRNRGSGKRNAHRRHSRYARPSKCPFRCRSQRTRSLSRATRALGRVCEFRGRRGSGSGSERWSPPRVLLTRKPAVFEYLFVRTEASRAYVICNRSASLSTLVERSLSTICSARKVTSLPLFRYLFNPKSESNEGALLQTS